MSQQPCLLERLPLHIAQYLANFLHQDSIRPFSLASKFCCQAAAPRRFTSIKLTARERDKFDRDVEELRATLAVDNHSHHVRRITLRGFLLLGTDHLGPNGVDGRFLANGGWNESPDNEGDSETEDVYDSSYFRPNLPKYDSQRKQELNEAWQPFADLIGQLSGLRDLIYACTHQIPRCILEALHQRHPRSRLHMHTFSLRSLYLSASNVQAIDTDEYALLTSPCLYSIDMKYEPYSDEAEKSFNTEALHWLIVNSPSLRKFKLDYRYDTMAVRHGAYQPESSWEDFLEQAGAGKSADGKISKKPEKHPLESLTLHSSGFIYELLNHIAAWKPLRSFTELRHLELSPCLSLDVISLMSMAAEGEIPSLRSLSVDWEDMHNNLGQLLSVLPHLDTLKLSGNLDETTFQGIHDGPRLALRKLQIYPFAPLDHSKVRQLIQWCPNLEDVRLRLAREAGPHETAIYRLLGRLPRLRRVVLQFVCPEPQYPPPISAIMDLSWDKFRDVRKALVEIAVDETLARAIFRKIAARKCPLERLKIKCLPIQDSARALRSYHAVSSSYDASWEDIVEVVGGRTWICTRQDVESPEVEVREVTKETGSRDKALECLKKTDDQEVKELWKQVWPPREGGSDKWWENWWSYPLSDILDDNGEDVVGGAGPDI
ncbi:hypothetical protein QC764_303170 [Podospora pseudoanserina]|uniref:F-box domain-containing protein n=1 Tax=Podospora pseudoanserina TaxID=2609844 RepID=A0ABR0IC40_9PEZI|nr:hypothetical protein QC764_303170 [Podospora pseudoanserina]